jgi:predicted NUDIX family NTP pyrophosphohydrolase
MWGIPKGLMEAGENILKCAIREFEEETSIKAGSNFQSLGSVVYKNGKTVHALTFKGTFPGKITSNFFTIEWPPSSGVMKSFPEIDRGEMYTLSEARKKIMVSQEAFIDKFEELIKTKVI